MNQILQLKVHLAEVNSKQQYVEYRIQCAQDKVIIIMELLKSYLVAEAVESDRVEYRSILTMLEALQEEIALAKQSFQSVRYLGINTLGVN